MIDLIAHNFSGETRPTIKCLDHGLVTLVDCMPRVSYDHEKAICEPAIVQAARVSYGDGTKTINEDRGLIRYLMRHKHTTPLEMVEFKFLMAMPMFVARQAVRHRTSSINEYSARYSVVKDRYYIPDRDNIRHQSNKNKQVSEGHVNDGDADWFTAQLDETCKEAYRDYEEAILKNVGREQARMLLPINFYTEWYFKIDLHNLLHFLALRCHSHAQQEIQVYGNAMLDLIRPLVPNVIEAWEDYHPMRGAVNLSKLECEKIKELIKYLRPTSQEESSVNQFILNSGNKREDDEWLAKLNLLVS